MNDFGKIEALEICDRVVLEPSRNNPNFRAIPAKAGQDQSFCTTYSCFLW